ncbi:glycosyltransferase family 4 protein [Humibacter ginsenosidimutans]|uniref:D-inositol 3-phosphate glycosyltransferase n=1 Tax=Humibacter ginsenosidimutans TaxID=2599293 RepID=A0A5B8M6Q2_9MICO|nr:glycosyltransferase family 1 protein [Humibacter ginsenosidimutans]QDZ16388.1 glycosyltransferase family 1 protein [Humibacter ginsenosidimutans]
MRVAIVSESFLPTVNGVTTSVCRVLDELRRLGHDATVICPGPDAPAEYAGFAVHTVPSIAYRRFPLGMPSPLVQSVLADFAPDVLHAASPFLLGAQAIAAAGRLGVATVAVYQTDVAGYAKRNRLGLTTALAWRYVRWVHNGADITLAPSTASADDLAHAGILRVRRWGRGVDLTRYHPNNRSRADAVALRESLSPDGEVVVGYVGRLAPEKQVERLAALRGMEGIRLAVVGDGPSDVAVRKALRRMPVSWLGRRGGDDLGAAYAALDMFVHTGTEETFGQTVQEAHAAGLPVVAPNAGGPIDLVRHGVDGLLFDSDRELRDAVNLLAHDAGLRQRMGEAGRRAVLRSSWADVCADLLRHYDAAIAHRAAAGLRLRRTVEL